MKLPREPQRGTQLPAGQIIPSWTTELATALGDLDMSIQEASCEEHRPLLPVTSWSDSDREGMAVSMQEGQDEPQTPLLQEDKPKVVRYSLVYYIL
jgi:hypothetical protein